MSRKSRLPTTSVTLQSKLRKRVKGVEAEIRKGNAGCKIVELSASGRDLLIRRHLSERERARVHRLVVGISSTEYITPRHKTL